MSKKDTKINKIFWRLLCFAAILLVAIEAVFLHRYSHFAKEGLKSLDGMTGFYAILSVVTTIALILIANLVALCLKKKEEYYDDVI